MLAAQIVHYAPYRPFARTEQNGTMRAGCRTLTVAIVATEVRPICRLARHWWVPDALLGGERS